MAHRQPVGVVFGIAPWNAPVILGVRAIAMPLACGNTVILKSSEVCPQDSPSHRQDAGRRRAGRRRDQRDSHRLKDAGAVSEAVIAHPAVKRVNFTGSTRVGKMLAQVAAKYLKPILLELGGKAPLVVLEDADLDAAVNATVFGAYANAGQICMSTERVIVDQKVADDFAARLAKRVASLPVGNPLQGEFVIGSVVGKPTIDRLHRLLDEAVKQGAKVLIGGDLAPVGGNGTVVKGVVVDHVTPAMALFREESFAPQVSITRAKDADEAIALANDTEYGLSAAIFTRDIARGFALAKRIDSGICHINGPTVADEAQMPFGGVKGSGYGRFGGRAGVDAFTELRWITVQTTPRHYPF
jgi:benzaldehyde dehydrogenase (NAD)